MIKLCIFCGHFALDLGHVGYSQDTPAGCGYVDCHMSCFKLIYGDDISDFRQLILKAETCKHFSPYKEYEDAEPEIIKPAIRKLDLDD